MRAGVPCKHACCRQRPHAAALSERADKPHTLTHPLLAAGGGVSGVRADRVATGVRCCCCCHAQSFNTAGHKRRRSGVPCKHACRQRGCSTTKTARLNRADRSERSRARHGLGAERLCKQRRWRQDPLDPCPALHACANGCGRGALGQGGHVRGVWVGPWGLRPADLGLALKPLTSAPRCLLPPTPVKAWVLLASLPAGPHLPGPGRRGWRFVARSRKLSQAPARASDAGRAAAPPAHSSPARILGGGGHA